MASFVIEAAVDSFILILFNRQSPPLSLNSGRCRAPLHYPIRVYSYQIPFETLLYTVYALIRVFLIVKAYRRAAPPYYSPYALRRSRSCS